MSRYATFKPHTRTQRIVDYTIAGLLTAAILGSIRWVFRNFSWFGLGVGARLWQMRHLEERLLSAVGVNLNGAELDWTHRLEVDGVVALLFAVALWFIWRHVFRGNVVQTGLAGLVGYVALTSALS